MIQDLFHLVLMGAKLSILGLRGDDANTTPVKIKRDCEIKVAFLHTFYTVIIKKSLGAQC